MEKNEHLKNQVLYITNPAYDALQSENLLDAKDNKNHPEHLDQTDIEK
ncbi:hypothetical protein [Bacillus timonensis]|nr:hypothetical protein [Bacillus timonensis]